MYMRLVEVLRGGEIFTMTEQEHKLLEAKDYFHKVNKEAFETSREYSNLQAKTNELREEWLGLCRVLKFNNSEIYGHHLTGLIMLKLKIRSEYRDVRFASLRMLRKSIELLAEVNRAYRVYMSLKKRCRKSKEDESCVKL